MAEQSRCLNNGSRRRRPGRETSAEIPYLLIGSGRILKVSEIIGMMLITPVPCLPEYVKGVINLRGNVIPVIDLNIRFGMASVSHTDRTCIVVVEIDSAAGRRHIGVVVDSVSDVISRKNGSGFTRTPDNNYAKAVEEEGGSTKILLGIDEVLSNNELNILAQVA
jgi:purine-binding chemotaxis protein CheW